MTWRKIQPVSPVSDRHANPDWGGADQHLADASAQFSDALSGKGSNLFTQLDPETKTALGRVLQDLVAEI